MRSQSSKNISNSLNDFIDSFFKPPVIPNDINKIRNKQSKINDSINLKNSKTFDKKMVNGENLRSSIQIQEIAPRRSKSEQKRINASISQKSYIDFIPGEESVDLSLIIEESHDMNKQDQINDRQRQVKFREHLIQKNNYFKNENAHKKSQSPSILKKNMHVRNNSVPLNLNSKQLSPGPFSNGDDRENRANKTNEVVRKRYNTIIERFETKYLNKNRYYGKRNIQILRSDEKYRDQLFPPIYSSLFKSTNKNAERKGLDIKWMRISQLFKDKSKIIYQPIEPSSINVIKTQHSYSSNHIIDAFNSIKNNKFILDKMFDKQDINEFGVYIVKIFQQNVWKYVIIDDYIPIVQVTNQKTNQTIYQPAFLNVDSTSPHKFLQIWPFLLQKAYANYYANYQSLNFGNTFDFIEQITGCSFETFEYNQKMQKNSETQQRLKHFLYDPNSVLIGESERDESLKPIFYIRRNRKQEFIYMQFENNYSREIKVSEQYLFQKFDFIHCLNPAKWIYKTVSPISINLKKQKSDRQRFDITIRCFKIFEPTEVSISIRQKQKRFYQSSSVPYNYIWVRALLIQKQFEQDYRWIEGKYTNKKSIKFSQLLESGQYFIVLFPQWKLSHCYEMSMIISSKKSHSILKVQNIQTEQIVEKACADLAQRFGKLNQVNLFICCYSYIAEKAALIIENINNERINGDVKIMRSISGLKSEVQIVPYNKQFYQNNIQNNSKVAYRTQISTYIQQGKAYTVILMMRGGIDAMFLKKFDFGK